MGKYAVNGVNTLKIDSDIKLPGSEVEFTVGQPPAAWAKIFYEKESRPHQIDLVMFQTDILITAGKLDEAEKLLEPELVKNPQCFPLLLRLGEIDEKRGQFLNAYDLYRQVAAYASGEEEIATLGGALVRVRDRLAVEVKLEAGSYSISVTGNSKPLMLRYNLHRELERHKLLKALLAEIDPAAASSLELGAPDGLVTRSLAAMGLESGAAFDQMGAALKALAHEYPEQLRSANPFSPGSSSYFHLPLDRRSAALLDRCDLILLLPDDCSWYTRLGGDASLIIKLLSEKAARQMFFLLPPGREGKQAPLDSLFGDLRRGQFFAKQPKLIFENSTCGQLYLVETAGAVDRPKSAFSGENNKHDTSEATQKDFNYNRTLLLRNPAAKTSSVLLVELQRCRFRAGARGGAQGARATTGWMGDNTAALPWEDVQPEKACPEIKGDGLAFSGSSISENKDGPDIISRQLDLYRSVQRHGYCPEVFPDGYIEGYLLKKGSDYRFMVTDGTGRLAALGPGAKGMIKVKFWSAGPRVIDRREADTWPGVQAGLFSTSEAAELFDSYFRDRNTTCSRLL